MFQVILSHDAQRYYDRLDQVTRARLDRCFTVLEADPIEGGDIKPIKGRAGVLRYRVGNLRVLYEVDLAAREVRVAQILPRGEAYKRRWRR